MLGQGSSPNLWAMVGWPKNVYQLSVKAFLHAVRIFQLWNQMAGWEVWAGNGWGNGQDDGLSGGWDGRDDGWGDICGDSQGDGQSNGAVTETAIVAAAATAVMTALTAWQKVPRRHKHQISAISGGKKSNDLASVYL
jgi:hypothetical protein